MEPHKLNSLYCTANRVQWRKLHDAKARSWEGRGKHSQSYTLWLGGLFRTKSVGKLRSGLEDNMERNNTAITWSKGMFAGLNRTVFPAKYGLWSHLWRIFRSASQSVSQSVSLSICQPDSQLLLSYMFQNFRVWQYLLWLMVAKRKKICKYDRN
jgi:hypothetical protein